MKKLLLICLLVLACGGGETGDTYIPEEQEIEEAELYFGIDIDAAIERQRDPYYPGPYLILDRNGVYWQEVWIGRTSPDSIEPEDTPAEIIPPSRELSAPCHTQTELLDFLEEVLVPSSLDRRPGFAAVCNGRIRRWASAPLIRVATDASETEREVVQEVVDRLNLATPWKLEIGDGAPPRQLRVPRGEIWIEFAPRNEWAGIPPDIEASGIANFSFGSNQYELTAGHVWVLPHTPKHDYGFVLNDRELGRKSLAYTVAHELLHILGFICHAEVDPWSGPSVITHFEWLTAPEIRSEETRRIFIYFRQKYPGDLDLDALKAIYRHDPGNYPDFDNLPEILCDY